MTTANSVLHFKGLIILVGFLASCLTILSCKEDKRPQSSGIAPTLSFPLRDKYQSDAWGVGDLNGDGKFDYVVKWPKQVADPTNWKRSEDTYKLDAYNSDGTFLYRYDMGWGIEMGVHYAPVLIYDINRDGKDEIYVKWSGGNSRLGHVESKDEWLFQLEGETGRRLRRVPWIERIPEYRLEYMGWHRDVSNENRNLMCIAYLDGTNPSLVVARGTYRWLRMIAFDSTLTEIWRWDSKNEKGNYQASSHGIRAADVDGDGRDEIVIGGSVVDEYGKGLWTHGKGHVDICHVADIVWDHPGLEIFLGWEKHLKPGAPNDVCVVAAATGEVLFGNGNERVIHAHSQGFCADILPEHPRLESYCGESNRSNYWFYTADGKRHQEYHGLNGLAPRAAYWKGTFHKTIVGEEGIPGGNGMVADILGDWREEIIKVADDSVKVYSSDIPTKIERNNLYKDRQYRMDMARGNRMVGYTYQAQESKRFIPRK